MKITAPKKLNRLLILALIPAISLGIFFPTKSFAGGTTDFKASTSATTVNTASTITVTWTTKTAYANGDSFTLVYPAAASASTTQFGQSSTLVAGDVTGLPSNTSFGSSTTGTLTINATGTVAAGTAVSITFGGSKITTPTAAGNFTISFTSTQASNSNPDFGSAVTPIGQANVVKVTGSVTSSLSFDIRNSDGTAASSFPYACNLGAITTTALSNCQYRLKVATNAASGFTVSYTTSGKFTNGSYNFADASGSGLTAGTESYGANINPGSVTASGATVSSSFSCTSNCTTTGNVYSYSNASTPVAVYTSDKPNNPSTNDTTNTALVTHMATAGASTPAGVYTQTVTYSVVASF